MTILLKQDPQRTRCWVLAARHQHGLLRKHCSERRRQQVLRTVFHLILITNRQVSSIINYYPPTECACILPSQRVSSAPNGGRQQSQTAPAQRAPAAGLGPRAPTRPLAVPPTTYRCVLRRPAPCSRFASLGLRRGRPCNPAPQNNDARGCACNSPIFAQLSFLACTSGWRGFITCLLLMERGGEFVSRAQFALFSTNYMYISAWVL